MVLLPLALGVDTIWDEVKVEKKSGRTWKHKNCNKADGANKHCDDQRCKSCMIIFMTSYIFGRYILAYFGQA